MMVNLKPVSRLFVSRPVPTAIMYDISGFESSRLFQRLLPALTPTLCSVSDVRSCESNHSGTWCSSTHDWTTSQGLTLPRGGDLPGTFGEIS